MTDHRIITIGRQFGSGGHEIGNLLATRLDIPLYDNNLVRMVADKLNIREETAQAVDETTLNSFLAGYVLAPMEYSEKMKNSDVEAAQPLSEQVFELQAGIIRKFADRGSCVIVGRCADYALHDYKNCINLFIHADQQSKVKRIMERYDDITTEQKAIDMMNKKDKSRQSYYNYYSSKKWGRADSYDLSINSGILGIDGSVKLIAQFVEDFENR